MLLVEISNETSIYIYTGRFDCFYVFGVIKIGLVIRFWCHKILNFVMY